MNDNGQAFDRCTLGLIKRLLKEGHGELAVLLAQKIKDERLKELAHRACELASAVPN